MKTRRASRSPWIVRTCAMALLAMTASCGMLIGIEDVFPGDGSASGGASGADASTDRTGSGGTGGAGGGTGGTSGASGAGLDANADRPTDGTTPGMDGANDARSDGGSDARPPDASDDRSTTDTPVPDGGTPDVSVDAGDGNTGVDATDSGAPTDMSVPDTGVPDVGTPDVGVDAPVIDVGSDQPPTITVTGKIIDFWRHVVPNVPVTIAGKSATTDSNGQFAIGGITPPYDVLFTISTIQNNTPAKYGWLYKGLTRTDPTLQVGRAFTERGANELSISVTSVDFNNLPAEQTVHTSFGSVDGAFDTDITGTPTPYIMSSWFGPTSTTMHGHAVHWTRASSTYLDAPTGYSGYATQDVVLTDSGMSSIAFDLPNMTMTTGMLSGSASGSMSGAGAVEHSMFVRFADNAIVQLLSVTAATAAFSYVTPSITGATLSMAASQGIISSPPYALVHKDGLSSTQSGITLQVPDASSLTSPAAGATGVNSSTTFRWSGTAKVFMLNMISVLDFEGFLIVTAEKQTLIPTMPDGPPLDPNAQYDWWIETHGSYQTVDEATGPDGMLDSFRYGPLWGPVRGDGSYTESEWNRITTAP